MPCKAMAHCQQVWQFDQTVSCFHLRGHLGNGKPVIVLVIIPAL
jgi:hypothetical protein